MKTVIIIGMISIAGLYLMACGMPGMPERMPASGRYAASPVALGPSVSGPASSPSSSPSSPSGSSMSDVSAPKPAAAKTSAMPLVLNEILYDLPGDDTNGDLFVELRGTPGGDLGGYMVRFLNGDDGKETEGVKVPAGMVVPDDGLFVIADGITGDLQHTHVANADFLDNFDPQNGPDSVQLIAPDGKLVDAVAYGAPNQFVSADGLAMLEGIAAPDAPMGQGISRLQDADDTGDNAADFVINTVPSPGRYDVTEAE